MNELLNTAGVVVNDSYGYKYLTLDRKTINFSSQWDRDILSRARIGRCDRRFRTFLRGSTRHAH